jgi:hypothetical protein
MQMPRTKLDFETADRIADELHDKGYDAEVREDYSGRGMHGETCVGIVTDAPSILIGWLMCNDGVDIDDLPTRVDSMGRSTIYY